MSSRYSEGPRGDGTRRRIAGEQAGDSIQVVGFGPCTAGPIQMHGIHYRLLSLFLSALGVFLQHPADAARFRIQNQKDFVLAVKNCQPGDELVLANGRWHDVDLLFHAEGTGDAPILLRAQTPGEVVLSGHSRLRIAGHWLVVSGLCFSDAWHERALVEFRKDSKIAARQCRFTNSALIDCNPPDENRESKYVSIYGLENRLDHCRLEGKVNRGSTVVVWLNGDSGRHRIDQNFFGPRPDLKSNGGETIRIGDSQTSLINAACVVESNLFQQCNGEAEIISNKSCENIYRYNTFSQCAGALTLRHGHRCTVRANWFLGQKARRTGGVRIIGEDHRVINNYFADLEGDEGRSALSIMNGVADSPLNGYSPVRRALIAFNSFVQCKYSMCIGLQDEDVAARIAPKDCVVANNLIVSRRGPLVDVHTPMQNDTWRANIVFGADLGIDRTDGFERLDPLLSPDDDGILRPEQLSPVVGAAFELSAGVIDDIDGQPRTGAKDIGCDQLSHHITSRRPLEIADVGPAW